MATDGTSTRHDQQTVFRCFFCACRSHQSPQVLNIVDAFLALYSFIYVYVLVPLPESDVGGLGTLENRKHRIQR